MKKAQTFALEIYQEKFGKGKSDTGAVKKLIQFFQRYGIRPSNISTSLHRYPEILDLSVESDLLLKIETLKKMNIYSPFIIKKIFIMVPEVFGFDWEKDIVPIIQCFFDIGLERIQIVKMIEKSPVILTYSISDDILPNLKYFKSVGFTSIQILKLIQKYPVVLGGYLIFTLYLFKF